MSKKKLQRFAEMETFGNVIQPDFTDVFRKDFHLKGKWKESCFGNNNPIVLELGCGKGEYTLGLASLFPDINFIGIDIKGSRIWKGASNALHQNQHNIRFLRTHIELINSFFGTEEIQEIWLTFPDPQMKKKRKRLTSSRFLNSYRQFLIHNGTINLKTDNAVLYNYTLDLVRKNELNLKCHTSDLYHSGYLNDILEMKTFYERQFLEQGLPIHYLSFDLSHGKKIEEP